MADITPIRTALEPTRRAAVERAMDYARETVERVRSQLEAAGWDLDKVAPYPKSNIGRAAYKSQMARREVFHMLTRSVKGIYRHGDPCIVAMSDDLIARFIHEAGVDASLSHDAFVAKMETKVGEHSAASLSGTHVWGYSFLTVTTPAGEQTWKTQMIVNTSPLGKVFNQWPSRVVKPAKSRRAA